MGRRARRAGGTGLVLGLSLSLALFACGSGGNGDVTLTIGSRSFPEQVVLGQIYAQALEATGYEVKRKLDFGYETRWPPEELKRGQISGYPEHVGTGLNTYFELPPEDFPPGGQAAYRDAKANFQKEGLTTLPPAPFALTYAVGMLRKEAEERGLKTYSDLKGQAEEMTLLGPGPAICHIRLDCLGGIETLYGVIFKGFVNIDDMKHRYKVLEDGQADASILYTTDGRLARERDKFVILEDDKHLLPAGITTFVTTPKVIDEAGPDFKETIVAVQKGLTLPVMQKLDAQVEFGKRKPAEVAAGYLKSIGFTD